jgi:hypothetical protein
MSSRLAASLARRGLHYGWVIAGVRFLTMLVTAGTVGAPGVLMLPLQREFGWETAEISSALGIRFVLFGLMAPFAAALINRFGMRRITLAALLIIATHCGSAGIAAAAPASCRKWRRSKFMVCARSRHRSYPNSRFSKRGCDVGCSGPEPVRALPQLRVQQPGADAAGTAARDPGCVRTFWGLP